MNEDERVQRSNEARRIWESRLMREAREHIEQALIRSFAAAPLRDDDGLRRIRGLYEAHKAYESFFKAALEDGKLAQIEIEHKKGLRARLRNVI